MVAAPQQALATNNDTAKVVVSAADATSPENFKHPAPKPVTSPPSNAPPLSESIVTEPQEILPTNNGTAKGVVSPADVSSVGNSELSAPKPVTSRPPNPPPPAPATVRARPQAVAINNYTAIAFRPKIASKTSNPLPRPPSPAIAAPPIPQRASTDDSISKPRQRKPRRRRKSRLLMRSSVLKLNARKKQVVGPSAKSSQIAAESLLVPISIGEKPEAQKSNFLPFDRMLEGLHCFSQTRRLTEEENAELPRHWLFWRLDPKTVVSFSAPPVGSWNDAFKLELDAWANFERAQPAPASNIVSSLVYQAAKLGETADHKVLTPDDKITFAHDGCKTGLKIRGHLTRSKLGELLQRCYYYLAIRHRIRQDLTNLSSVKSSLIP
jgi:hypothetical protein